MSRRRGEFEHRTSIFEGAYRAWSHLGGIPPADLASKSPPDLDPLIYQLTEDPRLVDSTPPSTTSGAPAQDPPQPQASPPAPSQDLVLSAQPDATSSAPPSANIDGNTATVDERLYPYEPLPRSGLAHPFVQAIISPWLGPNAEHDDTQIGLTTLRTWWQHRRKGESTSAKSALGTEKMRSVVDGYTRHFFNLAFCLVMHDGEQPPRTLAKKIKEMEKEGVKFPPLKKDSRMGSEGVGTMGSFSAIAAMSGVTSQGGGSRGRREETGSNKRHLGIEGAVPEYSCCSSSVLDMGSHHNGAGGPVNFRTGGGSYVGNGSMRDGNVANNGSIAGSGGAASNSYGDPTKTPVVFVSEAGDIQIAMSVSGMTCGNCVKIIETVLKGVNGQPSPIQGILDAAADRELSMVIIKIEKSSFAKRIAYEARESLRMVGYDAEAKEMVIIDPKSGSTMDLGVLRTAFDIVAATDSRDVFDWSLNCTCPDNGVIRNDCLRHSQMNKRIFEAFDQRQEQVKEFMGGCGRRYGLACSCGANCQCKSGSCCGPIADTIVENRNAVIRHDGTASENGARIRQASHSFSPIARNYYRNILDASSMGQMPPGNINIPLMPRNMMHTSANQFFDPNVQATMIQSQMPMRVPTTPIRTGNSGAIAVERMDLGERMDRNPASTHHQHLMSDYMRNINNSNDNFGGYTWKPESVDNQSSNTVNHSIFWNPP